MFQGANVYIPLEIRLIVKAETGAGFGDVAVEADGLNALRPDEPRITVL